MTSFSLVGLGNPLLDISAVVDLELLQKYDLKQNDAILADEKHKPLYKELQEKYTVEYVAGGAAQNTMRGAQYMLPANSTVYLGCVGNDKQAQILKSAAEKDGLKTEYLVSESKPTGVCGVLITDVHRCLVTDLQAANDYKIGHLRKPEIWNYVENAKLFYVSGYFLTVSPESAKEVAKEAADKDKLFTMNLSAPFIPQFFASPLRDLIEYWDVIFGNETEAAAFSESFKLGTSNVKEIAAKISLLPKKNAKRPRLVVFTQGTEPTIVAKEGQVTEFPIIPVPKEQIVDTNGAGDAFCGGFLSQLAQEKPIERCVAAGHYLANIVVKRSGPTYPSEPSTFY